jgi:hypothetical protein
MFKNSSQEQDVTKNLNIFKLIKSMTSSQINLFINKFILESNLHHHFLKPALRLTLLSHASKEQKNLIKHIFSSSNDAAKLA